MKWVKHYYNASYSVELNELVDTFGLEGYARYWLVLELLAEKFDGESIKFTLHFEEISRKVRIKFAKKLETFMQKLPKSCITFKKIREKVYEIEAPILLNLMDRDFKKSRKDRAKNAPKIKTKNKIKNKDKDIDIYSDEYGWYLSSFVEKFTDIDAIKKPRSLNANRVKRIKSLRRTFPSMRIPNGWGDYLDKILKTTFLTGGGRDGWAITFDWIIKAENASKILEGNYENSTKSLADRKQDVMLDRYKKFKEGESENTGNDIPVLFS